MNYSKTISFLRSGGYISKPAYVRIPHWEQRLLICQRIRLRSSPEEYRDPILAASQK